MVHFLPGGDLNIMIIVEFDPCERHNLFNRQFDFHRVLPLGDAYNRIHATHLSDQECVFLRLPAKTDGHERKWRKAAMSDIFIDLTHFQYNTSC
jgi:hypothetical protein